MLVSNLTMFTCSHAQTDSVLDAAGLPIPEIDKVITDFTHLVSENARVILSWKVQDAIPDFFAIERSDNGNSFETVTVLTNLGVKSTYQWTDDSPKKGKGFYRIRYSFREGLPVYSKTLSCLIEGYNAFKFYPNPVDQILIVRSETPLDVMISDGNGKVRILQIRVSGLQTINVSSLEKGVYLIRFTNKLSNTINQEKLIKN